MEPPQPLLTTEDVAALLKVHPKHVYRLIKRGLPSRRVGGEWRFERGEVLAWAGGEAPLASRPAGPAAGGAVASDPPPLLAANGDVVIELLLRHLARGAGPLVGFVEADRASALALLSRGEVVAAGCHGATPPPRMGGERLARIHLVNRDIGLAAAPGGEVPPLSRLPSLRVAARPPTAGTRLRFEHALVAEGLDPKAALAGARELGSHAEVLQSLARGEAEVGLTTAAWAERLGLAFRSFVTEPYGLVVRARDLGTPVVVRLCEAAQDPVLREGLSALAGYDASGAGDIRYDPDD